MKPCLHIAGIAWLAMLATFAVAGAPSWPYETGFRSYLLHVHPLVNYALHPDRLAGWERHRLQPAAFRGGFGSVATDELLVDAHWSLNPELSPGLRLRHDIDWKERRHLPVDRLDLWLGFELHVRDGIGAVVQVQPAEAKETLDLRLGAIWTSTDRTRYVQLLYALDDLVHDRKNDLGAVSRTRPRALHWLLRLERGPWRVASHGRWGRGFARDYPDAALSPERLRHEQTANELDARLRWRPDARTHLELSWIQHEDREVLVHRGVLELYDLDYAGWYRVIGVRAVVPLDDRWRLRGELHRLRRRAAATGRRGFDYHRTETLPALLAEWSWGARHAVEMGYLGTFYRWRYGGEEARSGFADKVVGSLILGLRDEATLTVSLSHEVSLERFGGGSVRLTGWW